MLLLVLTYLVRSGRALERTRGATTAIHPLLIHTLSTCIYSKKVNFPCSRPCSAAKLYGDVGPREPCRPRPQLRQSGCMAPFKICCAAPSSKGTLDRHRRSAAIAHVQHHGHPAVEDVVVDQRSRTQRGLQHVAPN